ncbi:MAG: hypothetical protein ACTHNG_10765 [Ginsengibacter sp.]
MNINRNNYEEYFLLYADNELSKAERKMVEVFVNENPDLKEEFCMLKLTINVPDENLKLGDKSFLYKSESENVLNENNYEEFFVLYHDNELSEKEKNDVENFVAQHPELKTDFELIGKAKLTPERLVVYPNKEELYRKEKSGKIISISFWKYAVAAVLLGFGLWVSVPYFTNQYGSTPQTAQVNPVKKTEPTTPKITPKKEKDETNSVASSTVKEEKNKIPVPVKKRSSDVEKQTQNILIAENQIKATSTSLTKPIQDLKKEPVEVVALKAPLEKVVPKVEQLSNAAQEKVNPPFQKTNDEIKPNNSQTVAYSENNSNNENYVFYDVPADQFKKTKVGGFLKKVKRIVERTNPITRLLEGNEEPVVAQKF